MLYFLLGGYLLHATVFMILRQMLEFSVLPFWTLFCIIIVIIINSLDAACYQN